MDMYYYVSDDEPVKARVFPSNCDHLLLSQICKKFEVDFIIGGPPEFDISLEGFQRESDDVRASEWFVAYLHGKRSKLIQVEAEFKYQLQEAGVLTTIKGEQDGIFN